MSIKLLVIAVAMVCAIGVAVAGAGENAGAIADKGQVYRVLLPGNFSVESLLYAEAPEDFDVFVLYVWRRCYVEITQQDLYIEGDTIAFGVPGNVIVSTSPECGHWEGYLNKGIYVFYSGYLNCSGGYPAAYRMNITAVSKANHVSTRQEAHSLFVQITEG
ncbi:hypothetical protein [Candidatus Alkanophaga liquidiphilum]